MRKGFDGLALLVQETLRRDPHAGPGAPTKFFRAVDASLKRGGGGPHRMVLTRAGTFQIELQGRQ
jgi:hypothetical protein